MNLFSKRNREQVDKLRYDIPEVVRTRILSVFADLCYEPNGGFEGLLIEVGKCLFKQYGSLNRSAYDAARRSENVTIEHFYCCNDEQAIDFIEACFLQRLYNGAQKGVDEINEIFRENSIGYELTPFVENHVERESTEFGRTKIRTFIENEFPKIIRKDSQFAHHEIVEPSLNLLADKQFKITNEEMLKAHTALRLGDFEDAITISGSAFESFLKTILTIKKLKYDSNRDTSATLVKICRENNIFPTFYTSSVESIGTIRNKLGDAHGRGPHKHHNVSLEHAEHMIRVTSSHMLLIAKLAGI